MRRQKGREMRRNADGTHPRSAAAVRNAESLVQIQMADVGADIRGSTEPDLGVHVGPIHVDLATPVVNHLADLPNLLLKDTMG